MYYSDVPFDNSRSLDNVEVKITSTNRGRSGFQMRFTMSPSSLLSWIRFASLIAEIALTWRTLRSIAILS